MVTMIPRQVLLLAFTCFIATSPNTGVVFAAREEHQERRDHERDVLASMERLLQDSDEVCPYGSFDNFVSMSYTIDVMGGPPPSCSLDEYAKLPNEIERALNGLGSSLEVLDTKGNNPIQFRIMVCDGVPTDKSNRLLRGGTTTSRNLCGGCWPYNGGGGGGCQACNNECDDDTAADDGCRRQLGEERELFATSAFTEADVEQFKPVKDAVEEAAKEQLKTVLPNAIPCLEGKELKVDFSFEMVSFSGLPHCAAP